jgi:hypothetical protein
MQNHRLNQSPESIQLLSSRPWQCWFVWALAEWNDMEFWQTILFAMGANVDFFKATREFVKFYCKHCGFDG